MCTRGLFWGWRYLGFFVSGAPGKLSALRARGDRRKIAQLAAMLALCLLTTLLTPYGYRLHVHVYQYLSDNFLMNSIDEFASPNFHVAVYGYFELFLLLTIALAVRDRISATGLLLVFFSLHAGLYAVRNIPISAILMSLALGPPLAVAISPQPDGHSGPQWLRFLRHTGQGISDGMTRLEGQFRGHVLASVTLAASLALVLHGGRVFSKQIISAHFDENIYPVKAAPVHRSNRHSRSFFQHR